MRSMRQKIPIRPSCGWITSILSPLHPINTFIYTAYIRYTDDAALSVTFFTLSGENDANEITNRLYFVPVTVLFSKLWLTLIQAKVVLLTGALLPMSYCSKIVHEDTHNRKQKAITEFIFWIVFPLLPSTYSTVLKLSRMGGWMIRWMRSVCLQIQSQKISISSSFYIPSD